MWAVVSLAVVSLAAVPTRIHVGSCSDPDEAQPMWSVLRERRAAAFFWGGDIVYGDDRDGAAHAPATAAALAALYSRQRRHHAYRAYAAGLEVVDGIWDDHDFGVDNAHGASFDAATKDAHKAALLDFLAAPPGDARRAPARGAYGARRVGDVNVILLDVRYDREAARGGGLLGETQWAWLEGRLADSRAWAAATVVVSPIQVLAVGERPASIEGWYQYPRERARLLGALANATALLVSGDVHFSELAEYACAGGATVAELTTSGLSHAWGSRSPAFYDSRPWHHFAHYAMWTAQRVLPRHVWTHQVPGASYLGLNAGEIDVDGDARTLTVRTLDVRGGVVLERTWDFDDLRVGAPGTCAPARGLPSVHARRLGFGITYALVFGPFVVVVAVAAGAARRAVVAGDR